MTISLPFRTIVLGVMFVLAGATLWPAPRVFAEATSTASTTPVTEVQESTTTPSTTGTLVVTDDAAAQSDSENEVNTNVTAATSTTPALPIAEATSTATTTVASDGGDATTTPEVASTTTETASTTPSTGGDRVVATDNAATTTSTTAAAANTGENQAISNAGGATVRTGDAYAVANAINVINTNIVGSTGLFYFKNLFGALGIDLRSLGLSYFTDGTSSASGDLTGTTHNTATTTSTVTAVATTGGNTASSTAGDAFVTTGNAYAAANATNLINTNIMQSKYLLVGVNDFGNLTGDITLPSAAFFEQLLARGSATPQISITTGNAATVTNATAATADTGGNVASTTDGSATLATGAALSSATTLNQINTNQVGGAMIYLLFRIWGNWSGSIQGLPAGFTWQETPAGLAITNGSGLPSALSGADTPAAETGTAAASTTNVAVLTNQVSASASTGANSAQTNDGAATVTTGNAYAAANTINMVNTNLVGTNWIYAIFNIFGNVSGNVAFGHPDLWIGASAQAKDPTPPDTPVTLRFTVANRGDAVATNVRLAVSTLNDLLHFATGSTTDTGATWGLGSLAPGAAKDFVYNAITGSLPPGNSGSVPVSATVTSDETDDNPSDNTDHLAIVMANPQVISAGTMSFTSDPKLTLTKTADVTATTAPATINYTVEVTNKGGPAYGALMTDVLRDPSGAVISRQQFNLDTIKYRDLITVTYSVVFAADATPGTYTNTVTLTSRMHYPDGPSAVPTPSLSATRSIVLLPPAVASDRVCEPYLAGYLKPGAQNDPSEVTLLQQFLRDEEGDNSVSVTGVYDAATIAAVKRFQEKYASDILEPWGYDKPTGYVYYTTVQKVNDIYCSGRRSFGLSSVQRAEIAQTRSRIEAFHGTTIVHVSTRAVTAVPGTAAATITTSVIATSTATSSDALPPGVVVGLVAPVSTTSAVAVSGKTATAQSTMMAGVWGGFSSLVGWLSSW